jgi:hypothetical protein
MRWSIGWLWRQLSHPLRFIIFYSGLLVTLTLNKDPTVFWTAYVSGPRYLRSLIYVATILAAISLIKWIVIQLHLERGYARTDLFYKTKSPLLQGWEWDPHWLPFDRLVEICVAPNLLEPHRGEGEAGWKPNDCRLNCIGFFENVQELESNYEIWCQRQDPKKLENDGTKYVLVNHPSSETDEHFVDLNIRATKWSRVQAALSRVRSDPETLFGCVDPQWTPRHPAKMTLTESKLPHSLCLHGFVITTDRKILALQRPGFGRTDYHPYAWSFSFEEQLADVDFDNREQIDVSRWLKRAVRQEVLGDQMQNLFDVNKARVLAIAIEEEIFNPFLVAYVPVDCSAERLRQILPSAPDRAEWTECAFHTVDPPCSTLANVFKNHWQAEGPELHPTSRYRIYLALNALLPTSIDSATILGLKPGSIPP